MDEKEQAPESLEGFTEETRENLSNNKGDNDND